MNDSVVTVTLTLEREGAGIYIQKCTCVCACPPGDSPSQLPAVLQNLEQTQIYWVVFRNMSVVTTGSLISIITY